MRKLLAILTVFLATCAHVPSVCFDHRAQEPAGAHAVIDTVWYDYYGMTTRPPKVHFLDDEHLDCFGGGGFMTVISDGRVSSKECVFGVYDSGTDEINLAWRHDQIFSGSSLCHELYHAVLQRNTGNADPHHVSAGYKTGGESDRCEQFLRDSGY